MLYNPYTKDLRCRVFDIETSGLYFSQDLIISASFCDPNGSGLVQYFTEDPKSEHLTISAILRELEDCDVVITYNGNSFDLPFALARAKKYGLAEKLPVLWKADIYLWLKHYWQLAPQMESLRQKAVEEALGLSFDRSDMIDGSECIPLYSAWLRTGAEQPKELILLHNADDVRQLAAITQKLSFLPYSRIVFENGSLIRAEGGGLIPETYRIKTGPIRLSRGKLSVKANIYPPCLPTAYYQDSFQLQSDAKGSAELFVYCSQQDGLTFTDLKKLPVDAALFRDAEGYQQDYLVLSDSEKTNYSACVKLVSELLKTLA